MKTANLLHVQQCNHPGCLEDALVTDPKLGKVQGYCYEHLGELPHHSVARQTEAMLMAALASLGRPIA